MEILPIRVQIVKTQKLTFTLKINSQVNVIKQQI